jgi:hypothetical protein
VVEKLGQGMVVELVENIVKVVHVEDCGGKVGMFS